MRNAALAVLLVALLGSVAKAATPARPTAAAPVQQLLAQNLAFGDFAGLKPLDAETAARIGQLALDGTAQARSLVAADRRSAQAHDLLGLFLTAAYRPASDGAVALRRGSANPAEVTEGLQELRTATRLDPGQTDYSLDYVWGLVLADQREQAKTQLTLLAGRLPGLSPAQQMLAMKLGAAANGALVSAPPAAPPAPEAAAPQTVTWLSFDDGQAAARRDHKRLLVDFMAEWCGWCKKMDQEVYSLPAVAALGRDFVFVRIDVDKQPEVARRYQVTAYPTVIVMDGEARALKTIVGYEPAPEFLKDIQAAPQNTPSG